MSGKVEDDIDYVIEMVEASGHTVASSDPYSVYEQAVDVSPHGGGGGSPETGQPAAGIQERVGEANHYKNLVSM